MLDAPWRIELFGLLRAQQGEQVITRFRTYKTGALFAYLACFRKRAHPREELIELLWPESDLDTGRISLRTALSSLRRQLEPPGVAPNSVLVADRTNVRLNPPAFTTDLAEFETNLQSAARATERSARIEALQRAVELYRGPLLPGFYEDWALAERERLAGTFTGVLRQLTALLQEAGDLTGALDYAHRALNADPLDEDAHAELMRLYMAAGQPAAAQQQYRELERLLDEELGERPSATIRALAEQLRTQATQVSPHPVETIPGPPAAPKTPSTPKTCPIPAPSRPEPLLPVTFTRFFGREMEIRRLEEMLGNARLVTLTGPGGSGKTRLAIEVGRRMTEAFGGAVAFVSLADVEEPRRIPDALLDALRLPRRSDQEPMEQIAESLNRQPFLLMLDNFEQLAAEGVSVLLGLFKRVSALTLLVTSRHRLALPGEREFPLPPLPLPPAEEAPEQLAACASVQLFTDRAQAVRPDFQVTKSNAPAIAALCIRLEGIPLAIELAASRAQTLTPAQMLERLGQRFELLATRRTDKDSRHRSLWAAIDWSYHLLTPTQQRFFARLSAFRGGWTLEAAEAVCAEPSALEYLTQLRERSLITAEEVDEAMRYRLLETLREYAAERLLDAEEWDTTHHRHVEYFLALAERAEPQLSGAQQAAWLDRLEREHENFRAALAWCCEESEESVSGLRLVGALWRFWMMRNYVSEGREHLTAALAHVRDEGLTAERAKALHGLGVLLWNQSDYRTARGYMEQALALRRELGDRYGIATMLNNLGTLAKDQGDHATARTLLEEGLALRRELGDRHGIAGSLGTLGNVAYDLGDYPTARALYAECLEIFRELGDRWRIAMSLMNLANAVVDMGEREEARAYYTEGLAIYRELGEKWGITNSLQNLSYLAIEERDYLTALSLLKEALTIGRDVGDRRGLAAALERIAIVALETGQPACAAKIFGATHALRQSLGLPYTPTQEIETQRTLQELRERLGSERFAAFRAEGEALSLDAALDSALHFTLS